MQILRQTVFLLFVQILRINAARILVIHAFYSGSPLLTWRNAGEYFASKGHHVHFLRWKDSHKPPPITHPNMTETVISLNNEDGAFHLLTKEKEASFNIPFKLLLNDGMSSIQISYEVIKAAPMFYHICDQLLGNQALMAELREMDFQVAIVDLVGSDCSLAFANHLGLPTIGFWGMQFASAETTMTTAFMPPSHAPNLLTSFSSEMTFMERLANTGVYLITHTIVRGRCWILSGVVEKHFPGSPDPCSLYKELSGMLINSDHIMDSPQLLPPTFVRVGGMHIRQRKALPEDLEEWMQSSGEAGVVLFSAGYTINPKVLPQRFIQAFFQAARKLPQKFLMKLEGPLENVPPNVKIMSWIPQQDVLAHNHTRLFVNHCGLQGVTEALFNAVPMIGMPIFFDQGDYLVKLVEHGVALPLERQTATADVIYDTLTRILNNPDFKRNAKIISNLMKDSPDKLTPKRRALNLVEYVVRQNGAPHLKMKSRHLNFFQYFCIDILALVVTLTFIIFKLSKMLRSKTISMTRRICAVICCGNDKKKIM